MPSLLRDIVWPGAWLGLHALVEELDHFGDSGKANIWLLVVLVSWSIPVDWGDIVLVAVDEIAGRHGFTWADATASACHPAFVDTTAFGALPFAHDDEMEVLVFKTVGLSCELKMFWIEELVCS
ncbi:Protein of unknown function [Pyronema omphalodes CBS 100304]|uniref:Uncharacterized protein n=1 Tax=Pyronema omphalodes (strain CBS 100304) TaxID=1076935 RepID=U4LDF3_PYROM|nr:Protein of unknown function [Pyronema omphalodes CBS 100304]